MYHDDVITHILFNVVGIDKLIDLIFVHFFSVAMATAPMSGDDVAQGGRGRRCSGAAQRRRSGAVPHLFATILH